MKKPKTKYQIIAGILDELKELITLIAIKQQHIKTAQKALEFNNKGWHLRGRYAKAIKAYQNELEFLKDEFNNLRLKLLPIFGEW